MPASPTAPCHPHRYILGVLFSLLICPTVFAADAGSLAVGFSTGVAGPGVDCTNGGSSSVTGSEIGKVTYIRLFHSNPGTTEIGYSPLYFVDAVNCMISSVETSPSTTLAPGPGGFDEFSIRPLAANWSIQARYSPIDFLSPPIYTHTFFANATPMGSGPQLELANALVKAGRYAPSTDITHHLGSIPAYEPATVAMRVANRSVLQTIAVTSPGWMLDGPAVNCTYTIENQVPETLECYHDVMTFFRVTPTAAGAFSLPLKLVTDDAFSPNRVTIDGTAVHVRKLTVLNGSQQISGTGARLTISQTWFATPKRIAFTLRNDDVTPLRFTCAIPAVNRVHCTAKTSGAPLSPLPVGASTTWEIEYTSSAMYWEFTPEITVLNDPGRVISFTVINDTGPTLYLGAAPYDGPASNGSSGGCGVGAVSSFLLLMVLGGWLSLRPQRRD